MTKAGLAQDVKERPILFSGPMVRAILEGRKTQTRRVLRDPVLTRPPYTFDHISSDLGYPASLDHAWAGFRYADQDADASAIYAKCPYGKVGGHLWVRETWRERGSAQREDGKLGVGPSFYRGALYRADGHEYDGPWRPSIFMPRAASRITLEILAVRVERLRQITAADVVAEGIGESWWPTSNLCAQWEKGWDAINGKRPGCAWKDDPWVWVLSFRRLTQRAGA